KQALVIMAKEPVPGNVKTRLCPPLTHEMAAELYRCFLLDSFDQYLRLDKTRVIVSFFPPEWRDGLRSITPKDFRLVPQSGDDLGERLINAFAYAFGIGNEAVSIVGSDHPTMPIDYIEQSFSLMRDENELILGPSIDGGYYLIGLKELHKELFKGITWSTDMVFEETIDRAKRLNLKVATLPQWYDVDTPEDLARLRAMINGINGSDNRLYGARRTVEFLTRKYEDINRG
ncbi:MAG: TIGR04282 family arsenosugar biosynthesis glycosyltransferase, partial [Nitrospinae bacterium]|nr:TIGR04282 family arsenosugar biosynthesis glycosyltransferase [Nitrospinota bacterium]